MKIFALGLLCLSYKLVHADCDFIIINYTNFSVTAQVGIFASLNNRVESRVVVKPNTTAITRMHNGYACNSGNLSGLGVAFIHFPYDPNGAGATYSVADQTIKLIGKTRGDYSGRPLLADNGTPIWLSANGRSVNDKSFEVTLNFVKRPNSLSAGSD